MKKRIIAIISAAIILLSLVSCAKRAAFDDYHGNAYLSKEESFDSYYEPTEMLSPSFGTKDEFSDISIDSPAKNDLSERKIIKNANIDIETKEYDSFMSSLDREIAKNGGYIESSEIYGGGVAAHSNYRNANVRVRIPADNYNSFMESVTTLGAVTRKNEYVDDVTLTYVDIESRIRAYETEYDALMELLANAESIDYIITLRQRISEIQYELESYKSQIRKYDDLIAYCTVNIDISEVRVETVSVEKQSFGERVSTGLEKTFHDIGEGFEDFSVDLLVNLPYILIWITVNAIIVFVIIAIVKGSKKKRAKRRAAAQLNKDEKN